MAIIILYDIFEWEDSCVHEHHLLSSVLIADKILLVLGETLT
jgi:hypothetical protein